MSNDTNLIVMTGRVDGAVDYRTSKAGKPFARFSLVSSRLVRDTAEDATLPCVVFGPHADRLAKNAKAELYVAGRLKTERWEYQGKPCSKLVLQVDALRVFANDVLEPHGAVTTSSADVGGGSDQPPF